MARGIEGNEVYTPRQPTLKKSTSALEASKAQQRSIQSFFHKKSPTVTTSSAASLTPPASSNGHPPSSPLAHRDPVSVTGKNKENGLHTPITPAIADRGADDGRCVQEVVGVHVQSSPKRAKKTVNYVEPGDEDVVFKPISTNATSRALKRRKIAVDSDDEFAVDADVEAAFADEARAYGSGELSASKTLPSQTKQPSAQCSKQKSSPPAFIKSETSEEIPIISTAQQWTYDPNDPTPSEPRKVKTPLKAASTSTKKQKAHVTTPEQRYTWLANITDADRNPPGHPDYDPRTLYIPPMAWAKFSPFEKQYWEIKQKFMDTIVFFKKGKFYELYEMDATIGHQLFDLKLTDRVNMRMVGVPEASLDHWANQFVAKGHKIARVDQMESALGKEMRERDDEKSHKTEKVIRRELASVLTAGTLVDGGMLQNDMSTYCVAIKEIEQENLPCFGVAFVDTATAQFHLVNLVDDADMTKFETLVAQIRPGELLLEKSCLSTKALRILKNNTGPTTIWNHLKPGKEFWSADITCREIDASGYFYSKDEETKNIWPRVLQEARDKELVMSAFGALLSYLRLLKIERDLISLGNFSWYDPIRKASSLVLDGQSLINLEMFANTLDGGSEGTLFAMLNKCVTPFGKRMLRQWVCHPLADAGKINARLDAVDALNADNRVTDRFTSSLTKLPDLERLISRVHAGRCKVQDFVRVLDGFEQIEYTVSLLKSFGSGEGIIGQLITSMPNLAGALKRWKNAFNRVVAVESGVLVPEPGVEVEFDASQERVDKTEQALQDLLGQVRKDLRSESIVYKDVGKEIYQLEVPTKIKSIPKTWDQMSATKMVKRYYTPELRKLVRQLQEAKETHALVVRDVAGKFYKRFDEDYGIYLAAVKIIAHLDCLISLAKTSAALGEPACRPTFVDNDRSVLDFEELRHPCMLATVDDFIPNDITLGGDKASINLLTGANAAGKSTILRMTCIAVIMAQVGCYVPAQSAVMTPVDRIMSRLGANDNIFAGQSTFLVELSETKKILSEATPRSLVILDELGRGTSSYDGVAVAQAVLHHVATHVGCVGFFATHYHSLAAEFQAHPEIACKRMKIAVDDEHRRVTFLYKLEDGVAEGSFGMHCASMCGIPDKVVQRAEVAAREWEYTSRLKDDLESKRESSWLPLGLLSDVAWVLRDGESELEKEERIEERGLDILARAIAAL